MIITCRNIFYLCLMLSVLFQPLRAEETADTVPAADPALEAVDALIGEDTGTDSAETTLPGTITPETIETEAVPEIVPDDSIDTITEEAAADTEVPIMTPAESRPIAKDVILVLDNSGSMKKNDPQFLASRAVNEFISRLDDESRVGIIIFDQSVRIAKPLTSVSDATRDEILNSLDQINYKGQFTDSPAAIERAIYDLKNNGRPDAKKLIVFMTDGIVDTGNADKDLEKAKWLRQDLAADAADAEISIFGIAFTEEADFQLIQSLSQQTEGEYYRALKPEDLEAVFTQVHEIINRVPEPEPVVVPTEPAEPKEVAPPPPPPQPVIIEVPVQSTKLDEEEELRSMMIMVALAVLIIAVIIMVLMLIRGSRKKDKEDEYAQEAFLNDINNYTSQATYKLGSKPTMLGRVAGTDTEHLNYIVIPQTTIGRRHALIEYKDFAYWIIDQGSINGTFVNDQMISSETRLKHGDRIRLHRYEFEFAMPEMVEAGMTVISNTVMAGNPAMQGEEPTIARSGNADVDDADMPEPDFDITGSADDVNPDEEDTVVRGAPPPEDEEGESSDETIMLGDDSEPVLPDEEDATLRPDMDDDEDLTVDDFMDNNKKK